MNQDEKMQIYWRIWKVLRWNEPLDARVVSDRAGVLRGRTCEFVREAVRWMRDQGLAIVSEGEGFCKSISPAKIVPFVKDMHGRADAMRKRADRLLGLLEEDLTERGHEEDARDLFGEYIGIEDD